MSIEIKGVIIGEGKPKVCVPIVEDNDEAILDKLKEFDQLDVDIIELRIDFYKNILQEKVSCKTVDGVSGSMLMINAKHMIDYGMYDENIFLYCEEISLAIKLKKAGLKTALLPNYNFVNNHSVSINKTYSSELKKLKLLVKSKLYVIRHYYDANRVSYIFAWLMSRISIIETLIWAKVNKLKA